jgi:hypothetical protein
MKIRILQEVGQVRLGTGQVFYFGDYRVPEDIDEATASMLLEANVATVVEDRVAAVAGGYQPSASAGKTMKLPPRKP